MLLHRVHRRVGLRCCRSPEPCSLPQGSDFKAEAKLGFLSSARPVPRHDAHAVMVRRALTYLYASRAPLRCSASSLFSITSRPRVLPAIRKSRQSQTNRFTLYPRKLTSVPQDEIERDHSPRPQYVSFPALSSPAPHPAVALAVLGSFSKISASQLASLLDSLTCSVCRRSEISNLFHILHDRIQ
jgi:hypothetical protein